MVAITSSLDHTPGLLKDSKRSEPHRSITLSLFPSVLVSLSLRSKYSITTCTEHRASPLIWSTGGKKPPHTLVGIYSLWEASQLSVMSQSELSTANSHIFTRSTAGARP